MGDSEGGTSSSSQIEPEEEGSTQNNTTVNIRVKTLSDQECIIPIGLHETVSVLRERIHEHLGIEPTEQRIIFQGRVLVTDRTLQSYSLQDGYTVHMIDRPPESSESFLSTRTGERSTTANGENSHRRARTRVHIQQSDPSQDSLLMRQSIGQIMPRLNNLTIEQADGADETTNRQAGRFMWRLFLEDNEFSLNHERIELYVRNSIQSLPFLTDEDRNRFTLTWVNNELRIDLPRMDPHVASPAFERLAFIELNSNYLRVFNDICQEPDGLLTIIRRILDRSQNPDQVERMTPLERHDFAQRLEDIIVRLESINSVLPSNRSIDDTRIRNSTEVQRQSRYERIAANRTNPSFVMRHAIDSDLAQVLREFRRQQARFFEVESVLDEIIETSAIPRIRSQVNNSMDNNYIAISAFYTHIQRMRHHISHTLHISSEIEVSFNSNNIQGPQRLLPNYELSRFNVPRAHIGTLIVAFRRPQRTEQVNERVSNVFSPPKIRADVGRMEPGQWPYLTFYPTGMLQEQHEMAFPVMTMEMTMEQVDEPMDETTTTNQQQQQPSTSTESTIEVRSGRPHDIMNVLNQILSNPQGRPPSSSSSSGDIPSTSQATTSTQPEPTVIPPPQSRRGIRERIGNIIPYFRQQSQREQEIPRSSDSTAATAGSATPSSTDSNPSSSPVQPSLPREMRGDSATLLRESQLISRLLAEPRRQQDMRTARGPETESLAPFPQTVSPTELHNIAQNIASRYRDEAITRIAANLTAAFQEQAPAWDTRLTSIPIRTQRFMLALVLELLTMSARNLEESREMMLALVRDESILIRAIIESMKSLFLLGEFPTHVGRIILQQHSTVGQRVDYESRDGSDSDDTDDMVVRMPSDVSQPRTGSLRDIANARARRRQIVESRRNTVEVPRQPIPAVAVGPSLRAFDQAQVEAGILPTGPIRQPSSSSSSSNTQAAVRVAQLRALLDDTDELFRDDFARMQEQLTLTQQRIASRLFNGNSNNSDQNPSTSETNNIGPMTRVHRQTVSIDPFLSCHNRHSDFNRAHNLGSTGSEGDRMTNQSNDPNPNYNNYVQRLDIPQRDTDSVVDDEDFTYEITRNASGELQLQNTEEGRLQFQRIMQTAFRSLFGQLVESDAIIALNSVNMNGFPAPRNEVVQEMLERHPFMVAAAQSASDNLSAPEVLQRPRSAGGNVQISENDASRRLPRQFFDPTAAISSSLPNISNLSDVVFQAGGLAPRNMRAPAEFDISYPIPTATEVASDALSGLHSFLQSHVGSFPRGLFGLLCELLRNRIGRNDLGGLINQEVATRVIGSMQNVFRQHLIDNQMNGNTRPSRDDIQSVAERLAAEESFFNCYNLLGSNIPLPINIRGRIYSFGWTFRQLEIDTIRRLLELVLKKTEKDEFVKSVIDIIKQHLQRMLSVFYWFYEGNYENMRRSIIDSFPAWIRTLRSMRNDPETVQIVAASNRIVQIWFDLFSEESTNEVAQFFERLQNPSSVSNLRTCSNKSNSNSPSSSPSTRERCGDVEEVGETSAKRRRCDEEMEVDIGEEVMEDYNGTEDDNKPQNSNDKTK